MKRRTFLKASGGALALSAASSVASADHLDTQPPDHVTLTFDESALEQYRPRLITRHLENKPSAQYSWIASSPEHDTDAYCYWTWYVTQEGFTNRDSHYLDREPVYVFVDEDEGEIREVVYAAYHWLAGRTRFPSTDDDDHPLFVVAKNHHHYFETRDDTGELIEQTDLNSRFEEWLANGWEEDLHPGAAQNPWVMSSLPGGGAREYWWRDNQLGFSTTVLILRVSRTLGLRGARRPDV